MNEQILKDVSEIIVRLEELRDQWKEEIRTNPQALQIGAPELYLAFQGVGNNKPLDEHVFQFDRLVKELASCDEPELKDCGEKLTQQYSNILHLAETDFEDASFGRNLDFQMSKVIEDLRTLEDELRKPKNWSRPMMLQQMALIIGMSSREGFKQWAKVNQCKLIPLGQKTHVICCDNMPPDLRAKFIS